MMTPMGHANGEMTPTDAIKARGASINAAITNAVIARRLTSTVSSHCSPESLRGDRAGQRQAASEPANTATQFRRGMLASDELD
jgi:hypothetical protein